MGTAAQPSIPPAGTSSARDPRPWVPALADKPGQGSGRWSLSLPLMIYHHAAVLSSGSRYSSKLILMIVGVPTEVKTEEYRVALTPSGARTLLADGHQVLIQRGAGVGSGYLDGEYEAAGARLIAGAEEVFAAAELIVKVKEPLTQELSWLRPQHILFGFLHLASSRELTEALLRSGAAAVAYETLEDQQGGLPLLTPMSEIAGRLSVQAGAKHLEAPLGGRGVLLGGIAGVPPGRVVVIGGGVVGTQAALMAAGLGADVAVFDVNLQRLRELSLFLPKNVSTLYADPQTLDAYAVQADLVIGAVLVRGRQPPRLISHPLLRQMQPGAVIVDVCIDQGGCVETARPTTHANPTYVVDGVVHYCVANMPGAVGRTSTRALCNATLPYIRKLAGSGLQRFVDSDIGLAKALNVHHGQILNADVASVFH